MAEVSVYLQEGDGSNPIFPLHYHQGTPDLHLEFCSRSDIRYRDIRDRHYVANKGPCGQQIHFLIHYKDDVAGIISGGSAVYATHKRDRFFNIAKTNRE
jgi:hypothetical protein